MQQLKENALAYIKCGGSIAGVFAGSVIAFFAILILAINAASGIGNGYVTLVLALALAVPGWKSLTAITPDMFLIMPLAGWLVYFCVKGFLSIIVGFFAVPVLLAVGCTKAFAGSQQ